MFIFSGFSKHLMLFNHCRKHKGNIFLPCVTIGLLFTLFACNIQHQYFQDTYGQQQQNSTFSPHINNNNQSQYVEFDKTPIYTENTKSTNTRVISIFPEPIVEVTYNGNSSINGSPTQTIGTIIDTMGKDGVIHSEGKAIILTASGQLITYRSESIGYYKTDGSFSDNGIIFFNLPFYGDNSNNTSLQDSIKNSLHSEFDNVLGIYKKTVDPAGNGLTKVWKWG